VGDSEDRPIQAQKGRMLGRTDAEVRAKWRAAVAIRRGGPGRMAAYSVPQTGQV